MATRKTRPTPPVVQHPGNGKRSTATPVAPARPKKKTSRPKKRGRDYEQPERWDGLY